MAEITMQEMQRQIHQYAMEEMRNRGLEEAAKLLEQRTVGHADNWKFRRAAEDVRALKRDPAAKMTDWWDCEKQQEPRHEGEDLCPPQQS